MEEKIRLIKENLNRQSPLPIFYQLAQELGRVISSGLIKPGERLPGELYLARILEVNYRTVQKALLHLQSQGLVRKIPYRGTFVQRNMATTQTVGFFYPAEAVNMLVKAEHIHRTLATVGHDLKINSYQGS
ncbi:MAG: winged helix-turn-helix domain-containing protein, partial [Candidatus Omnitrophica bacterium]|nr:winged helix-turn-helix domain-containing protein [Candidatus Omnitrophota bacterium]